MGDTAAITTRPDQTLCETELAFVRMIGVDVNDPAPFLVYSDWLQEQGRMREANRIQRIMGPKRIANSTYGVVRPIGLRNKIVASCALTEDTLALYMATGEKYWIKSPPLSDFHRFVYFEPMLIVEREELTKHLQRLPATRIIKAQNLFPKGCQAADTVPVMEYTGRYRFQTSHDDFELKFAFHVPVAWQPWMAVPITRVR